MIVSTPFTCAVGNKCITRSGSQFQRGVTLIELMIAMTLGLAIVAAVGYVYISGTVGYKTQDAQSRMQEDARFITETVSRDVRMAGFFGCTRSDVLNDHGYIELVASAPVMTNPTDWLAAGTAVDRFVDVGYFIRGISAGSTNASPALPGYAMLSGSLQANTDVVLILRSSEDQQAVVPGDSATFGLARPLAGVSSSDNVTLVVSNCEVAKIIKPTYQSVKSGSTTTTTLKVANGMNKSVADGGKAEEVSRVFGNDATVSLFTPSIFYVAKPTAANPLPTLRRATIAQNSASNYGGWQTTGGDIVATGVETFQTSYFVTANLGTTTATSSEKTLADMEANPSNWPNVTAVRVRFTMVAQATGTAVSTADSKLRQNYDFTVGVRSRQYKGVN